MKTPGPYNPIVKPTSHPLYFEVQSSERPKHYHFVDLQALGFNGSCTCPHSSMRLEKLVAKQGHAPSDRTRCKHVLAARAFFLNVMVRAVARDIAKTNPRLNTQNQ